MYFLYVCHNKQIFIYFIHLAVCTIMCLFFFSVACQTTDNYSTGINRSSSGILAHVIKHSLLSYWTSTNLLSCISHYFSVLKVFVYAYLLSYNYSSYVSCIVVLYICQQYMYCKQLYYCIGGGACRILTNQDIKFIHNCYILTISVASLVDITH